VVPVVWVPSAALSTEVARGLLPGSVPHADAAFTAGRAGLLVAALTAPMPPAERRELLLVATEDRLHQRFRAPAMPESAALIEDLRSRGVAAVVSGAGPTVLAFLVDDDTHGNTASDIPVSSVGEAWETRRLPVDNRGVQVIRATRGNL
jgi:homoserine kinase